MSTESYSNLNSLKKQAVCAFFKQDMEVSVFELITILNNVVSHREYIELILILTFGFFYFH